MTSITDEILLEYLDGTIPAKEAEYIKEFLENNADLKARLKELKLADQIMMDKIQTPSPSFTETVLDRIARTAHAPVLNMNKFLIVVGAMLTVVLGSYFITDSMIDLDLGLNLNDTIIEYVNIPAVDVPKDVNLKLVNQVFLYSISFLILLIFDRAVLRPYFKRRKEYMSEVSGV